VLGISASDIGLGTTDEINAVRKACFGNKNQKQI
jgi:hypothetical protein